jgi:hypothetical protein
MEDGPKKATSLEILSQVERKDTYDEGHGGRRSAYELGRQAAQRVRNLELSQVFACDEGAEVARNGDPKK